MAESKAGQKRKACDEVKSGQPNVLLIGTGEYTTGYVHGQSSKSDKGAGVVGLAFFDMRRRKLVGPKIGLCGTSGTKFPGLREHLRQNITERYNGMSTEVITCPADSVERNPNAFRDALQAFEPGDIAVVTTPDDTHFPITMACVEHGLHVMVTKPLVKTLAEHQAIAEAAKKKNVLVCLEFHKRYDPIYSDAVNRIRNLGDFGYFQSFMSQPKYQLSTFKSWAGVSSDISYYLNSHHIDIHEWAVSKFARPVTVSALGATGVAKSLIGTDTEDTIAISTQWENMQSHTKGVAVYTASWGTPKTDVHSEQNFHYIGHKGQIKIDQAHRGVALSTDADGYASINPLYMRYTPDAFGNFVGQSGYGYQSFEVFVNAVNALRAGSTSPADYDTVLPTVQSTMLTTAILEAGRRSLDQSGATFSIVYDAAGVPSIQDKPA